MKWVRSSWAVLRRVGVQLGPYLMVELLLPGGSLMAVLLYMYRRRKAQGGGDAPSSLAALWHTGIGVLEQWLVVQPHRLQPLLVVRSRAHGRLQARERSAIRSCR